ncbi:hypothetical protein ACFL2B_03390, partial [Patescibacteria group bacterium]
DEYLPEPTPTPSPTATTESTVPAPEPTPVPVKPDREFTEYVNAALGFQISHPEDFRIDESKFEGWRDDVIIDSPVGQAGEYMTLTISVADAGDLTMAELQSGTGDAKLEIGGLSLGGDITNTTLGGLPAIEQNLVMDSPFSFVEESLADRRFRALTTIHNDKIYAVSYYYSEATDKDIEEKEVLEYIVSTMEFI